MRKLIVLVALVLFVSVFGGKVTDLLKTELGLKNGRADILIQLEKQVDFDNLKGKKKIFEKY